jgi:hypothetical protein
MCNRKLLSLRIIKTISRFTSRNHKYNDDIRSELGVQSITEILDQN